MKSRIILYISALLIFWVYRSFQPAPKYDRIEIVSDQVFRINDKEFPTEVIDDAIGDYRKSINPDKKKDQKIIFEVQQEVTMGVVIDMKKALRKNELLLLFFPKEPIWRFWD